jgi:hypothetical protein
MWCVVEQKDVPGDGLQQKTGLGWVRSPPDSPPHTVDGAFLGSTGEVFLPTPVQASEAPGADATS